MSYKILADNLIHDLNEYWDHWNFDGPYLSFKKAKLRYIIDPNDCFKLSKNWQDGQLVVGANTVDISDFPLIHRIRLKYAIKRALLHMKRRKIKNMAEQRKKKIEAMAIAITNIDEL